MPPLPGQKGTGKKARDAARQSRSRNTTPSLVGARSSVPPAEPSETALLELPVGQFRISDEIVDNYGLAIPSSKDLESLLERLHKLNRIVEIRSNVCDKGMRLLAKSRKERLEDLESQRRDEEQRERSRREAAEEEEKNRNKANKKKRKELATSIEERNLTVGVHGVAPQDGSKIEGSPRKVSRKPSRDGSASSSLSPVAVATPAATGMDLDVKETKLDVEDSDDDDEEEAPPPKAKAAHQTFGPDPTKFDDPTVYECIKVTPDMSHEEKKKRYSVAVYPKTDLADLIPGTPPDKDFSNAKPSSQVQANTFATYLEPYFRPYTEEDLAFLRERGDRVNPFIIPRRGKKHYTEVWAEEDGAMSVDSSNGRDKLPPNQARGSFSDLTDAIAETDQVSAGPILSRLLATMRPEHRAPTAEEKPTTNGLTNGEANVNGEANGDLAESLPASDAPAPLPPATYMPESTSESWKKGQGVKLDYPQVDERIKQELRHIGFLPQETEPDYDAHYDDEIAARLRFLQEQLKEQAIINAARKARLMEMTKERMAHQEYTTILEDLDTQVQQAFSKRTRTMGKSKKAKRPGGAGGGSHFVGNAGSGMARPGIGDVTKTLMERRTKWIDGVGRVFDNERSIMSVPRSADEGSSIFKPEDMSELIKKERQAWDEDPEDE